MSRTLKLCFLGVLFFTLTAFCFAALPEMNFTEGNWVKEGDTLTGSLAGDEDFASAYFATPKSSFILEADFTLNDIVNYSRWVGVSFRANEDKTVSHMLRIKQKTSLANGIEVSFLEDERWRSQFRVAGDEFLELGKTYKIKVAVSNDYFFALLNDKLIVANKFNTNGSEGYLGLHTNGATVKFSNISLREYSHEEMSAYEYHAEWQAGRDRAAKFPAHPIIVAHRGNSSEAPENTLAAVRSAILVGADAVEIDVYSTVDGEIILSHDSSLTRCTNGSGDIKYQTAEYLRSLDAGSKFNRKFAGEKMPFLREVLEEIKDKIVLVIEIKQYGIEDKIIKLLDETGTRDQVVIISFLPESLARFHDLAPDVPTSVLTSSAKDVHSLIALAARAKTRSLDLSYALCSRANVEYLISRGYSVWAWTVDDPKMMQKLVNDGVSVITTNVPRKALNTFRPLD